MLREINLWSNNCWIEDGKGWFCAGEVCALLCADMASGQCKLVEMMPESDKMQHSRYLYCIKYKDTVFCLPYFGKYIWYYDLNNMIWGKIEIGNESYLMFFPVSYKQDESKIWLLEDETGKLFEVNLSEKVLEKEYYIPRDGDAYVGEYVLLGSKLYCVSGDNIYCIDIPTDEITVYKVSGVKKELYTICFDGNNFWLGGCCKEIYVWNPMNGIIKTITEFPERFGFYHFKKDEHPFLDCNSLFNMEYTFFSTSLPLGDYIWYITCRSNGIIYIDKKEYKVFYLEVEDEQETQESVKNNFHGYKFQFEYIREDRYIGVYSVKNRRIFEIDTVDLCVRKQDYRLEEQAIISMVKACGNYDGQRTLRESKKMDDIAFAAMIMAKEEKDNKSFQNVGERIYYALRK